MSQLQAPCFTGTLKDSRLSFSLPVRNLVIRVTFPPVVAAYLLAVLGGNTCPSAENIKDILTSVGGEADDDRIELLLTQVKGKDITKLIASRREKLASVPAGGSGAVAATAPAPAAGGAAPTIEAKKEEKVEEKEESDDNMGSSLFD